MADDTVKKYTDKLNHEIKVTFISYDLSRLARSRGFWLKATSDNKKRRMYSAYTLGLHELGETDTRDWMYEYCPIEVLRIWMESRYGVDFVITPIRTNGIKTYRYEYIDLDDLKTESLGDFKSHDDALSAAISQCLSELPELMKVK